MEKIKNTRAIKKINGGYMHETVIHDNAFSPSK